MAKATKETEEFWKEKITEWKASGLSQKGYCEKNGLNRSTANYWFRKLLKEREKDSFVEIKPLNFIGNREEGLRVCIGDKYKIEVTADNFDALVFKEVVKVLEALK